MRVAALTIAIYATLLAFDLWFLLVRPDAPWEQKAGLLLGILGVYTFAFAFISQTDVFKRLSFLDENDLTSPNLFKFTSANRVAVAILTQTLNLSKDPLKLSNVLDRSESSAVVMLGAIASLVEALVLVAFGLLGFLLLMVSIAVYLIVVAPIAYTAYAFASIFVEGIEDIELKSTEDWRELRLGEIRAIVKEHKATVRSLLVAIPSLVFSIVLNASFLF